MAKNKRKNKAPKREPAKVPIDYVYSVADAIHRTNPNMKILMNALIDFYSTADANGYRRRIADNKYFQSKRDSRIQSEWNSIKDKIDDQIHSKNQINK